MGDKISDRIERDRRLFTMGNRQQLVDLIGRADPRLVAGAITRALELQIITEEIAREAGIECDGDNIADYAAEHHEEIDRLLERTVNAFICSIVSQEG